MSHVSAEALTTGPMKNSEINSPPAEVSIKWAPICFENIMLLEHNLKYN